LIQSLDNATGAFLLSCYDLGDRVEVPPDWQRFEFNTHCSASGQGNVGSNRDKTRAATPAELGNRTRVEIVYKRGPKVPPRDKILARYQSSEFDCFTG